MEGGMEVIYQKRSLSIFVCLVFLCLSSGCSKKDAAVVECPAILEQVEQLLTQNHQGKDFFLVKRISGWHDKTIIIQLFDQPPQLGACNEDLVLPVFEDSIEIDKPLLKIIANMKSNQYQLIYGESSNQSAPVVLVFE